MSRRSIPKGTAASALGVAALRKAAANRCFAASTGMGIRAGCVKDAIGNEVFPSPMGQFIMGTQPSSTG